MKKFIFTIGVFSLLFSSCSKLDTLLEDKERKISYNVLFEDTPQNFEYLTTITYTGEDGYNLFEDHQSAFSLWSKGGNFSKGDRISLSINTSINRGTITLSITCKECKNDNLINNEIKKIINLSTIKVGELSLNLE